MGYMFDNCYSLQALDLSGLKLANVSNMSYCWRYCKSLKSIELPAGISTSALTSTQEMFLGCYALTYANVSSLTVNNVTNMQKMFEECTALTEVDLADWTLKKQAGSVNISRMFYNCRSLATVFVGSGWVYANINTSSGNVFDNCTSIKGASGVTYTGGGVANAQIDKYLSANSVRAACTGPSTAPGHLELSPVSGDIGYFDSFGSDDNATRRGRPTRPTSSPWASRNAPPWPSTTTAPPAACSRTA